MKVSIIKKTKKEKLLEDIKIEWRKMISDRIQRECCGFILEGNNRTK